MDEASAIDHPKADGDAEVDSSPNPGKPKASGKRSGRRGLTSRKRLALTIDAELTSETGQQNDLEPRDGQSSTLANAGNNDYEAKALGDGDDAVPWWVLEYRCPPPGHLGAHHVPVAAKDGENPDAEQKSSPISTNKDPPVPEEKESKAKPLRQVFGRQVISKPEIASTPEQQQKQIESARDLRQRRQHAIDSIDNSPSQKRKFMHVHEHDPSTLSSTVVAKEPKRFHEPSSVASTTNCAAEVSAPKPPQQMTSMMTPSPSNLVRPLNKIDIHSTAAELTVKKTPSVTASHASKSA